MFTKNYYLMCASTRIGVDISAYWTSLVGWGGNNIKKHTNYINYGAYAARSLYDLMRVHPKVSQGDIPTDKYGTSEFSACGVCFGSGTTPPTEDDYRMEGDLFTTYNYSQTSASNKSTMSYTYTITNTGTEDFTIREVGLIASAYAKHSSNYYYYSDCVLLERTVLESPITIPANGGVGQITYTLKMDGLE